MVAAVVAASRLVLHVRELTSSQREEMIDGTPVTVHRRPGLLCTLRAGRGLSTEGRAKLLHAFTDRERLIATS